MSQECIGIKGNLHSYSKHLTQKAINVSNTRYLVLKNYSSKLVKFFSAFKTAIYSKFELSTSAILLGA